MRVRTSPERGLRLAARVQQVCTMHGTTMISSWPCRSVGFANVPRAADDRRRATWRPPPQRIQLLAHRVLRFSAYSASRGRAVWGRNAPEVGWCAYAPSPSARFRADTALLLTCPLLLSGFGTIATSTT